MTVAHALMPIGELARRADVPVKTLRHWSDLGVVPPAHRTPAGYRMYGEEQRLRLETVKAMRRLGFDLPQIVRALQPAATHDDPLAAQLDAVRTRLVELHRLALVLEAALERYDEPTAVHLARLEALAMLSLRHDADADAQAGVEPPDVPTPAQAAALRTALPDLRDRPTTEQVDAWLELAALLAAEPDGTALPDHDAAALLAVLHDAMDAIAQGCAPEDPAADELAERLLACAGAPSDDTAVQRVIDRLQADDLHSRRRWRLVARVRGWPAGGRQTQAIEWLRAALRARHHPGTRTGDHNGHP